MEYIIALGAFQALVALSLFIGNRQRKPADNLLNWLLVCIFSHLSIKFVIYAVSDNAALQNAFNTFIALAYGPLLWMYVNKVLNNRYRPLQHWYLLLPMLAAGGMYFTITIKIAFHPGSAISLLAFYNNITQYLMIASSTIFPLMCLMLCYRMPVFWKSEQQLIRKIAICFLVIPVIWMVGNIIRPFHFLNAHSFNITLRIVAYFNLLVISFFIIRYRMMGQEKNEEAGDMSGSIVSGPEQEMADVTLQPAVVSRKSVLTENQQAVIANRLSLLMQEKKVYMDAELTLEKLASLMKTPRHHLSEVLNQYLHRSFYQFINDHRMQEVLNLLDYCRRQETTPNILSIAYEAGFNSKSAFNQYFKKTTGFTPTEYFKRSGDTRSSGIAEALSTLRQQVPTN